MTEQILLEIYKTIFETWRSQVESYWRRSAYFAAFETAAIGASWHLLHEQLWANCALSTLGVLLTLVWLYNNHKVHSYVNHWWSALERIERKLELERNETDFVTQQKGGGFIPYHGLIQTVPAIFLIAWLVLFVAGLLKSCACLHH
jgi:hypothetical protein